MKMLAGLTALLLFAATNASAATEDYKGTAKGANTKSYTVKVEAGQTLSVSLKTKSSSVFFRITPVGTTEAIWNGEAEDDRSFERKLDKAGVYRIDVFLARAEAQRGGQASFTLTVSTEP